jgi:hypothetical protein
MSTASDLETLALQCLKALRPLLLQLHKDLMDSTKLVYEQHHGTIQSRGEYFRLVLDHEFFSWLRPISQFIVRIDERIATKKPSTAENAEALVLEARQLLSPLANSTNLEHPYRQAILQNPEIAAMHTKAMQLLELETL